MEKKGRKAVIDFFYNHPILKFCKLHIKYSKIKNKDEHLSTYKNCECNMLMKKKYVVEILNHQ